MKKLPEISVSEWMDAERELKQLSIDPQPKGSVTVEQFATMTKRSIPQARKILGYMKKAGIATSQPWRNGNSGLCNVYFLKSKKPK